MGSKIKTRPHRQRQYRLGLLGQSKSVELFGQVLKTSLQYFYFQKIQDGNGFISRLEPVTQSRAIKISRAPKFSHVLW